MSGKSLILSRDEFAAKYDYEHALRYHRKHNRNLWRRVSDYREKSLTRRILGELGQPETVLDLPCGTGRFWPVLAETPGLNIIAADSSQGMLRVAEENCPREFRDRITILHTSAYDIDLADDSVDTVLSMRLLHHIGSGEKRMRILKEFRRVSRKFVILSLWVDGNFKAWRRVQRDRRESSLGIKRPANRFLCRRETIAEEFRRAGLEIIRHYDLFPYYSMWRFYLLRVA